MKLTPRLEAAAAFVPPGSRVLDVGTDHGYLPIVLLQRGIASRAIASDVRSGPLAQARANARAAGLDARLELRQGSGLSVVQPGEVDVAILAGMGGLLILNLLEQAPQVAGRLRRLILAPNTKVAEVRRWAAAHGFRFAGEDLVAEGWHRYAVLCLEPVEPDARAAPQPPLSDVEAELGPLLLRQAHVLLPDLVRRLILRDRRALHALREGGATSGDSGGGDLDHGGSRRLVREETLRRRLAALEEVLRCWPK